MKVIDKIQITTTKDTVIVIDNHLMINIPALEVKAKIVDYFYSGHTSDRGIVRLDNGKSFTIKSYKDSALMKAFYTAVKKQRKLVSLIDNTDVTENTGVPFEICGEVYAYYYA